MLNLKERTIFFFLFPWTFIIKSLSLQSISNLETLTTMIRGKTKFKCDDCGHVFEALDIEWQATAYSTPMPCPKCGSRHTMPKSLFGFVDKGAYRRIWEETEKYESNTTLPIMSRLLPHHHSKGDLMECYSLRCYSHSPSCSFLP